MSNSSPHYDYDVVIIGAGLIGLSAADSLLSKGLSVCVTDINSAPMAGTSFSNSGMVHPSQSAPWAQLGFTAAQRLNAGGEVLSLANRSAALIAEKAKALGLAQTSRAAGCLQIFHSQDSWQAAIARCDALGIAYTRQPSDDVFGNRPALFFPQDHSGNAHDYGMALAADVSARGAKILTRKEAELWLEAGRVIGVRLGDKTLLARHTVLAAGMASKALAAKAGLNLPLKRAAGWAVNYAKPADVQLPDYPVMEAGHCSAISLFGDTLRLSGTVGEKDAAKLIDVWTKLAPDLMAALGEPLTEPWTGNRPVSETGKPMIGRSKLPGLWVNTGHGHMGWTLCAGSGELLADMIVEGRSPTHFSIPAQ